MVDGGRVAGWSDSDNNATQPGWGLGLAGFGNKLGVKKTPNKNNTLKFNTLPTE